jgi:hypothetical protein
MYWSLRTASLAMEPSRVDHRMLSEALSDVCKR